MCVCVCVCVLYTYTFSLNSFPSPQDPVVLTDGRHGTTVAACCRQVHRTLITSFDYAMVWGTSVKHTPQRVGLSHQLDDEDVIQIVKKRNVKELDPNNQVTPFTSVFTSFTKPRAFPAHTRACHSSSHACSHALHWILLLTTAAQGAGEPVEAAEKEGQGSAQNVTIKKRARVSSCI